jgi:hypothetical protein
VAQKTQEPVYWAFVGLISAALTYAAEDLKMVVDQALDSPRCGTRIDSS